MDIDRCNISTMYLNRIIGRSSAGSARVSIFALSGELGARSPVTKQFICSAKAKRMEVRRVRRSVYCTASFSVCSRRRTKFPLIYPDLRLDYKVATHPFFVESGGDESPKKRNKVGENRRIAYGLTEK